MLSSFFNKGNYCEIENSKYFDAMVEMVYFLNMFLYCKIIISFLELFPTKRKKCQRITFMMTSSNDDKSNICRFFYQDLFHVVNTVQNFM